MVYNRIGMFFKLFRSMDEKMSEVVRIKIIDSFFQ